MKNESTVGWLEANKIIEETKLSPKCHDLMNIQKGGSLAGIFRCKPCSRSYARTLGTYFFNSKLNIAKILQIILFFWIGLSQIQAQLLSGVGRKGVSSWYETCRKVAAVSEYFGRRELGGEGREVEVDEAVFCKRKYHRGRRKPLVWLLGLAERPVRRKGKSKLVIVSVPDRSAKSLQKEICKYCKPKTTIITDELKSYTSLPTIPGKCFKHKSVCHKRQFVNPLNGACTNRIEGIWHTVRAWLPRNGIRKHFLSEFIWTFLFRHNQWISFNQFVSKIAEFDDVLYDGFAEEVDPETETEEESFSDPEEEDQSPVDFRRGEKRVQISLRHERAEVREDGGDPKREEENERRQGAEEEETEVKEEESDEYCLYV
jgi:hypothetical protein